MKQQCSTCRYWKKDYGMWTATGWTGMERDNGDCHLEPTTARKSGDDFCSHWTDRAALAQRQEG